MTNEPTLIGIFDSRYEAELALDELRQAGFGTQDVDFAIRGEDAVAGGVIIDSLLTKDGPGAVKGMVVGGVAGGLLGAAAVLVIPGVGPILALGVLASALGLGLFEAMVGAYLGALFQDPVMFGVLILVALWQSRKIRFGGGRRA